ncbi:sugar phosphate isomerase/epimerase family protein [Granulicella sibirica]|uniref:Xylose isomerase-like TIM barrel n=1 Tax=Granulicella sibirica TaxID=2479048 RepID=A0A4Q0T152_9BACT|nr:sugar phosphate isomerase/epimerase family protein [Granulicella sibirica]RXH56492.1 Xylose isomerase-like TIM barrel [Granulicella sibirica]
MPKTYGIMQGRLAPPEDNRFQSFPRNSWREEIPRAREAGLDYIEWIHDAYGESANPIFTSEGRAELAALKAKNNIATPALCGDWFMDNPFLRCTPEEREHREQHLHALLPLAAAIGANRMVIPIVDNSRMQSEADKQTILEVLRRALPQAEQANVELHLETDLNSQDFAAFLSHIEHPMLRINWDSGNSSGLGYIAHEEFAAYGPRIGSIHIKDRYRKPEGGIETRPLGTGSADFDDVFQSIRAIDYQGGLTLQVARGTPNEEVPFIKTQIAYVKRYWS